ncbi:TPA: glutamine-hydrolyzing carbamoyl-phosphate synthase small subunit [Candidatus Woesearchaeota archaeon]|nr:glutamine-hydrolyzing carbamoyl-phosphate synthase small subunit [Candidatus Woesearchaeota archaeon]HIH05603.1 glutamine-hydrolyzing carbamoyl-phosphate synthase small subunit [Candidatus Woesearchaeota archaeon]HIH91432.1 glutamine-hydrolyzing carbamoyl-phosphate synthase small subunit [Candidatus Woesearchaeota archaeon]HII64051.1 glutamine-hydrolyzing carbamoyl-phosphate synthase small subunit [Candidatus Woesearchaeota archaeon]HIJ19165.1 glutamine-hydrolyzing carbamoyl-phosphate syntha
MWVDGKLVLSDGTEFRGISFGAEHSIAGEVVFNTGMVGYPEAMTDPSYKGQILALTYPLIGNYGVPAPKEENGIDVNFESGGIRISALIVSEYSQHYSHWNAGRSLSDWLKGEGVPALYGIDTRRLTKMLREKGAMLGKVVIGKDVEFYDPNADDLVAQVSIGKPVRYAPVEGHPLNAIGKSGGKSPRIILVDCGMKNNMVTCLTQRGATVLRVPYDYDFTKEQYDGLFISNGPGDPKMCTKAIAHTKKALEVGKPIFGVCLGNQILALAAGGDTYKLKYGHRSQNQPCIQQGTKRCFITTQNHGFAVDMKSLDGQWEEYFINANDGTNEGIRHRTKPFRSVQFHPEARPGPVDAEILFDDFMRMVGP